MGGANYENLKPHAVEQIDTELQVHTKTVNFILQDVKWKRIVKASRGQTRDQEVAVKLTFCLDGSFFLYLSLNCGEQRNTS